MNRSLFTLVLVVGGLLSSIGRAADDHTEAGLTPTVKCPDVAIAKCGGGRPRADHNEPSKSHFSGRIDVIEVGDTKVYALRLEKTAPHFEYYVLDTGKDRELLKNIAALSTAQARVQVSGILDPIIFPSNPPAPRRLVVADVTPLKEFHKEKGLFQ